MIANRLHTFGWQKTSVSAAALVGMSLIASLAWTEDAAPPDLLASAPGPLSSDQVPPVPGLENIVRDTDAAIVLGKALFWDMQAGSDGQACASCHFHAGADSRALNQLNPGTRIEFGPPLNELFDPTRSGAAGGPNYRLRPNDFPFHVKAEADDRDSDVIFDTDDVASSQGVFQRNAVSTNPDPSTATFVSVPFETCDSLADNVFHVGAFNTRRVEPRNSPSVINAVFNFRNFWDGRANNVFNGVDEFGYRNDDATIIVADGAGEVFEAKPRLINSSLASQAVGPPLSGFEMSCGGRRFAELGRKLLAVQPLQYQEVDPTDSVLGLYRDMSGDGLDISYDALIEQAFAPEYWQSDELFDGFTHKERNFSLYWGLAIQLYESTLVSDETPFDAFASGDTTALGAAEKNGLDIFLNKGKCINCHKGPDFTGAGLHLQAENQEGGLVERMLMGDQDRGPALYDNGFYNIGVRPTFEDIAVGGLDPFGHPLSFTRQYVQILRGLDVPDPFEIDPCKLEVRFDPSHAGDLDGDGLDDPFPAEFEFDEVQCDDGSFALVPRSPDDAANPQLQDQTLQNLRVAVDGAFKTSGLRNVELTGPYFHNGGASTLEQVVEFYNRGGDFAMENERNLDPDIVPLGLSVRERADLVLFLKTLTDERVRWEQAPFDHPELWITDGHVGDTQTVIDNDGDGFADDRSIRIRPVGAQGRLDEDGPLQPFERTLAEYPVSEGFVNDEFSGSTLSGWSIHNPELAAVTVDNGALILEPVGGTAWYNDMQAVHVSRAVSGDFTITTSFQVTDLMGNTTAKGGIYRFGGLLLRDPTGRLTTYLGGIGHTIDGTEVTVSKFTDNGLTGIEDHIEWGSSYAELRICRVGADLRTLMRGAGGPWMLVDSLYDVDLPYTINAGPIASAYASDPDLRASFDWIEFQSILTEDDCWHD